MKLTERQKQAVYKKLGATMFGAFDETMKGLTTEERALAIEICRKMPQAGSDLARILEAYADFDVTRTLPDFGDATEVSAKPYGHPTNFGRNDFLHCEPTIDPDRTYIQQLEFQRVEILEKLAALQTEIQTAKDGLSSYSRKKFVDGLRTLSADPRAMAAKRAQQQEDGVIHGVNESLNRQTGNLKARRRLREAEDHAARLTVEFAKNYLTRTTKR